MTHLTTKEQQALMLFKARLMESFADRIDGVSIFGSKARGDAAKHSDIDVIVVLKSMTWQDKRMIRGIAADIIFSTEVLLSVQVFSDKQVETMKRQRAVFWQMIEPDLQQV